MNPRGFPTGVAAEICGLSLDQVRRIAASGMITPSIRPARGRGRTAHYSFFDLIGLKVIERLRAGGDVPVAQLAPALSELRKTETTGWIGQVLYTTDWRTFHLAPEEAGLPFPSSGSLLVCVLLGGVDRDLRDGLAAIGLGAPGPPVSAQAA